jgi:hypothetical protein
MGGKNAKIKDFCAKVLSEKRPDCAGERKVMHQSRL